MMMKGVDLMGPHLHIFTCRGDESRWEQEFSRLHVVHTGSGAHTAFYPMGNRGSFPGGKAAGALKLTIHPQLVPRSIQFGTIHQLPYTPSWHSA
jgi:hypothetical protein